MSVSVVLNLLLFILFLTVLGPPCCVRFSLVAGTGDYALLVHGLLTVVVPLVVQHRLEGAPASVVVARGLNNCAPWALEPRLNSWGTWA